MRYLIRSALVMALAASPVVVGAQDARPSSGASSERWRHPHDRSSRGEAEVPRAEPTPGRAEPKPKEGVRGVRRWHPDAFTDPSSPAPKPALKLEVDSTALEVTPTAPPTLEELERTEKKRQRRAIGIAVGVTVGAVLVGLAIGAGVAMANWEL